jgi:beta-lactamase regulating signal transducer with metallopeptidase domain/HEAT repeat protein
VTHFIDAILEPALWFAADWSLRWAVLIGVMALMMLALRPRRAATRQLMCWVTLLGGLLLPILPRWGGGWHPASRETAAPQAKRDVSSFSSFPSSAWERTSGSSASRPPSDETRSGASRPAFPSGAWERERTTPAPSPREVLGNRRLVVLGLVLCWALGVFGLFVRWLGGAWFLRRLRRGAVDVQESAAEMFAVCRAELRVRGTVHLLTHPHIRSPVLLGLFRPAILVPSDWTQLSADVQRAALLHELAHVRRRDHWLAPLLETIRVAFFFHPFVRWLLGRLEYERELLCDEIVVGRGVDRRDYARMLLEFARQSGRFALPRLPGSSYLPIGRRRAVKARINHLMEENMERWMGSLPARWAVVGGAGLLALSLGLASYRIRAVEPEKPAPVAAKEKEEDKETPKKTPAARAKCEALRYGGKNFDQWRTDLETELKPEIRADGLTALAAFGANGYGPEATRTVLELMKGYELDTSDKKDQEVVEAAIAAIAKIDEAAVPLLSESLQDDNRRVRRFASQCLLRSDKDLRAAVPFLLKAARDEDKEVAARALQTLVRVKDKPKDSLPVFLECLKDKESDVRFWSLRNVRAMRPEAAKIMSVIAAAIKDADGNVRGEAFHIVGLYGAQAKPVVPALLELLDKPDFHNWLVEIMDALAAIGPGAKEALPRLRKLRESPISNINSGRRGNLGQLIAQTIKKIEGK